MKKFRNMRTAKKALHQLGKGEVVSIGGRTARVVSVMGKTFKFIESGGSSAPFGRTQDEYKRASGGYARANRY